MLPPPIDGGDFNLDDGAYLWRNTLECCRRLSTAETQVSYDAATSSVLISLQCCRRLTTAETARENSWRLLRTSRARFEHHALARLGRYRGSANGAQEGAPLPMFSLLAPVEIEFASGPVCERITGPLETVKRGYAVVTDFQTAFLTKHPR